MNLHGFLATNKIYYASDEAVEFTDIFFYTLAYYAFLASNKLAKKYGSFYGFEDSEYYNGKYFEKYTKEDINIKNEKIAKLFEKYSVKIPTKNDWKKLSENIHENGLANAHLLDYHLEMQILYHLLYS